MLLTNTDLELECGQMDVADLVCVQYDCTPQNATSHHNSGDSLGVIHTFIHQYSFHYLLYCHYRLISVQVAVLNLSGAPSGGPKLTQRRYHCKGSCYVTVGLLGLGLQPYSLCMKSASLPAPAY